MSRTARLPLDVTRPRAAAFYSSGMDDAALVARVLEGDVAAFTGLVHRHYQDCARFAVRMLGDRHDAEDAIQETFLSAYAALGRYREQHTFRAWLFRILVNRCRSVARQRGRRRQRFVEDGATHEVVASQSAPGDPGLRDTLQRALDSLEPRLREAFLLKYGEELEYREMSAVTGVGVSALKMRVKRACDALRPQLENELDA
jgi:RNA polymerase sigma-70 factor (ECF subfamily)